MRLMIDGGEITFPANVTTLQGLLDWIEIYHIKRDDQTVVEIRLDKIKLSNFRTNWSPDTLKNVSEVSVKIGYFNKRVRKALGQLINF